MTRARWALFATIACTPSAPQTGTSGAPATIDAPSKIDAPTKIDAPATPSPGATDGDWLVWWYKADGWTTRWLRSANGATTQLGERRALIVGDGARVWQVERADGEVEVKACECFDDDGEEDKNCKPRGRMPSLGLRARELGASTTTPIVEAPTGTDFGDDISHDLSIVGGVQNRLLIFQADNGYFCGAHGLYESGVGLFDLAAGTWVDQPFTFWKDLPADMRRAAATKILPELSECEKDADADDEDSDPPATVDTIMNDRMSLIDVAVALRGGQPELTWNFAVDVPYFCSVDYRETASETSSMIPQAAPLGLAGPLPDGVLRSLAPLGDADALGFSRLDLPAAGRDTVLAAFLAAPEPAWPAEGVSDERLAARSAAQDDLDAGRKKTRAKDYAAAIAAFDRALSSDPELASGYSGRGYAHLLAGDFVKAKADFAAALTRDARPEFQAAVYFNLGTAAERSGDLTAAKTAYEKSNTLRPTRQAKAALDALAAPK